MPTPLKQNYAVNYLGRPRYFGDVYAGRTAEIARTLASPGENALINTPVYTQGGHTVIFIACYGGANVETVKLLLDNGAELYKKDLKDRTPYHYAANSADPNILRYLFSFITLQTARNLIDSDDRTLLHAICCYGSSPTDKKRGKELSESLRILLVAYETSNGSASSLISALNQKDRYGFTPLHYAKYYGYTEIFDVISELEQKLDTVLMPPESELVIPNDHPAVGIDFFGRTKLQELAFDKKEEELKAELEKLGPYNNPTIANPFASFRDALHYAVCGGTRNIVQMILDDPRTNPMSRDINSITALHFAAHRGDPGILDLLLKDSFIQDNINAIDVVGMTALHALAMNNRKNDQFIADQIRCIEMLCTYGINLLHEDNNGFTAAQVARLRGNIAVAEKLERIIKEQQALDALANHAQRTMLFRSGKTAELTSFPNDDRGKTVANHTYHPV